MTDDMLRAVRDNGGAVCVNFGPEFLDAEWAKKMDDLREDRRLRRHRTRSTPPIRRRRSRPPGASSRSSAPPSPGPRDPRSRSHRAHRARRRDRPRVPGQRLRRRSDRARRSRRRLEDALHHRESSCGAAFPPRTCARSSARTCSESSRPTTDLEHDREHKRDAHWARTPGRPALPGPHSRMGSSRGARAPLEQDQSRAPAPLQRD